MDEPGVAATANDVYANPPDVDVLELEPGHPGLGDEGYVARRNRPVRDLPLRPARERAAAARSTTRRRNSGSGAR